MYIKNVYKVEILNHLVWKKQTPVLLQGIRRLSWQPGLWTESSLIIACHGSRRSYSFVDGTYLLESINFTVGRTGGASSQQRCIGQER